MSAPFPVMILAAVLLASCGNTAQGATPKVFTGNLTFASFNPFTAFGGVRAVDNKAATPIQAAKRPSTESVIAV